MSIKSIDVQPAARLSAVREVNQPLAWLGSDRLLLDDTSRFGLRRRVIARKGEMMDMVRHISQAMDAARGAEVDWWMFERGEFWFLWIVWKER